MRFTSALRLSTAVAWACCLAPPALAQSFDPYQGHSEWNPVAAEIPQLPPYCRTTYAPQTYPGPAMASYNCGDWINHLCPAWVAIRRAMNPAISMTRRRYALQLADGHLRYTRSHLTSTCQLASQLQMAEQEAKIAHIVVK